MRRPIRTHSSATLWSSLSWRIAPSRSWYARLSPTLKRVGKTTPDSSWVSPMAITVVPIPKRSGCSRASVRTARLASSIARLRPSTVESAWKAPATVRVVSLAATSPAAWPPMPSAMTASTPSTKKSSSLRSRTRPVSVAAA